MKKHRLTPRQREVLEVLSHRNPPQFFLWTTDGSSFVDTERHGATRSRFDVHGNVVGSLINLEFIMFTGLRSWGMDRYTITPKGREALNEQS